MGEPLEMFRSLPFPFDRGEFPATLGAVVQGTVLSGQQPVREVVHASDGSWLVGDGVNDPNEPGAVGVTHIWRVIRLNPAMTELATMPPGHIATRTGPGDRWIITTHRWPHG